MRQMLREMDKYAYLAVDAASAASVANLDPGSQKTRLLPGVTNQAVDPLTAAKTEVLPAYISQETAVRTEKRAKDTDQVPASAGGKLKRRAAFAGAGTLLLIAGLAAGAYVYDPTYFSTHGDTSNERKLEPTAEEAVTAPETAPESTAPDSDAGSEKAAEAAALPREQPVRTENGKAVARQSSKTAKGTAANTQTDDSDLDLDDMDLDGKTLKVGNVQITDRKIVTPKVYIDENGIAPRTPPVPPVRQIHVPDMRYLTPAQRRRLQQQLRRKGLIQMRPGVANGKN